MVLNYRMRFYLILFFCGLGFLFSCGEDKKIPGNIIPMHQMSLLLTDIHLVDGSLYNLPPIPDTLSKHGLGLYMAVFKLHHIDTTQFKESLKYYSEHTDLMNDIYAGVTARLDSTLKVMTSPVVPPVTNKASQKVAKKTAKDIADSIKNAQLAKQKTDSIINKRKTDSVTLARFKAATQKTLAATKKAKRDSIKKAKKHKRHKKTTQTNTNAVPNK